MSLTGVFDIAGMGMSAQTIRLNTVASNLANAETIAPNAEAVYRSRHPVFQAGPARSDNGARNDSPFGVLVTQVIESQAPPKQRYQPQHPLADEDGYVYFSNVNAVEEMADMISASRAFQMNVEMMNTSKSMMQRLLTLGQ